MTTLPKSRFLDYFVSNKESLSKSLELIGDLLIVERMEFPQQKTAGGIILSTQSANTFTSIATDMPGFYRVLMVGAGYYSDETKESVPLDIKLGDVVLTGSVSVKMFSIIPMLQIADTNVLGVTRHSDVQARFKGEAALVNFLTGLNASVQKAATNG